MCVCVRGMWDYMKRDKTVVLIIYVLQFPTPLTTSYSRLCQSLPENITMNEKVKYKMLCTFILNSNLDLLLPQGINVFSHV